MELKYGAYSCSYNLNKVIYLFYFPSHFFVFAIGNVWKIYWDLGGL